MLESLQPLFIVFEPLIDVEEREVREAADGEFFDGVNQGSNLDGSDPKWHII